jgi:hypothetical protein
LNPGKSAVLDVYGSQRLPPALLQSLPDNIVFHGPVTQDELFAAFGRADLLVFPTLCDGFGLVVTESFARGLPVLTTRQAGASDLVVDGRRVAKAGAPLSGSFSEVISGSRKIGAVPALTIDFTQLVVADGTTMPVAIRIVQTGASEKGRDTAKIVGGTAAGAIIGHQIDDDKGKVIGGILGGAAGAIGAQKTGTEVELAAGTVLAANVRTAFTYDGR